MQILIKQPGDKETLHNMRVAYKEKELLQSEIATQETAFAENIKFDDEFSIVLPKQKREKEMQVVNRKKLLPDVTIGLTKEEAAKLAKVLGESDVEIKFCLDLLADLDLVELEEQIRNK